MAVTRDKAARDAYGKAAATAFEGVNIPNQVGGFSELKNVREPTLLEQATRTLYGVSDSRHRLANIMGRLRGYMPQSTGIGSESSEKPSVLEKLGHARISAEEYLSDIDAMLSELEDLLCRE